MSSLVQPQQPVQIYPYTAVSSPPPYHSSGSFGTVFIVLAVIVVISAIACLLGRFCSRRSSHKHTHNQKPPKHQKKNHHNFRPKEGDLEIGFDKRIASSKPIGLGHGHGYDMHGHGRGRGRGGGGRVGPKPHFNGDMKGFDLKIGHDGELKAGV
ncbi:uncharacterized protein LOC114713942 [Neltuma alba]|uniref:uncharacterized protein LOC114713942 n=1 Tax=Neltuma alba TaxID=207710 RepID=UPI0010A44464|nr:uncharacterized protein LOC114713942 [Prosopis alba]